ncbi:MAG: 4Fe-4S binding protein [Elusimicrobia bacterium]|nr:4Fe-4S binding protein [Elusimicrobiota bacterium]
MKITKNIVLKFSREIVDQPIVCKLAKVYDLSFNIIKAYVTPRQEGYLILQVSGRESDLKKGFEYLTESGVKIEPVSQDVVRNEEKCTHCGVCVGICPVGALAVDEDTRKINFYSEKCTACGLCINVCPVRAMEVRF